MYEGDWKYDGHRRGTDSTIWIDLGILEHDHPRDVDSIPRSSITRTPGLFSRLNQCITNRLID